MGAHMTNDTQRAAFEAWCKTEGIDAGRNDNGVYFFPSARVAWRSWQAARAQSIEECATEAEIVSVPAARVIRVLANGE
jgi:hypothetical protein